MLSGLVGRVATAAFRPAVAFTGRLRYAQKFVAVGLVLLVPLASIAIAYVTQQRQSIELSERERHGVALIGPLSVLNTHLVNARHAVLTGVGAGELDLAEDLARVDPLDRRYGGPFGTSDEWHTVRQLVLTAQAAEGEPLARLNAYNTAADALLALIGRVGDESGLTLDTDLDSYYLIDLLQNRLPLLLDVAGRATDLAALADSTALDSDSDAIIQLGVFRGVVSSTHVAIRRAVSTIVARTANAEIRTNVLDHFQRLDLVTGAFDEQLRVAVKNRRIGAALAGGADSVRSEATYFAVETATMVDTLLRARIAELSSRANRVQVGGLIATGLAVYLFVGFYLSVATPIRRIVAALNRVADGDLTQRVTVDTHDELSTVARTLNDTITRTEIATNRLGEQATRDALTGLPNRAYVLRRLDEALAQTRRGAAPPMAVLFIDLDRFKIINDSLGHAAGDTVLRTITDRLGRIVRPGDLVARLAGDEFLVITERLTVLDEAVCVAERIVEEVARPITIDTPSGEHTVGVGASVGIAFADGDRVSCPDELLRDADVAMYQAKKRGRGRVEIFDDTMRTAVESRLQIQEDLRQAIRAGQVLVHYQPIVDIVAGRTVGFEALARWEHSNRGMMDVREVLAVADEAGLSAALGSVVLADACRQAAQWRATRPGYADLGIAVNVSGKQFGDPGFVPTLAAILADTGLPADALWLEVTETSIMSESATSTTIDAVRALGVRLVIDDFGTGQSSLTYLHRYPVSALKIDRSFTAGLGRDTEAEAIVAMVVSLAVVLQLPIIAKGVETVEQLDRLRQLGCTYVQGFHVGAPAPAADAWPTLSDTSVIVELPDNSTIAANHS